MRGADDCTDRSRDGSACWRRCRVAYDLRYVQSRGQRDADLLCAFGRKDKTPCSGGLRPPNRKITALIETRLQTCRYKLASSPSRTAPARVTTRTLADPR